MRFHRWFWRRWFLRAPALAALSLILASCAPGLSRTAAPPKLLPVSYESGVNRVRLALLGRYAMGFYDIGGAAPAAYDPRSRRLFVVGIDRGWIDVVDLGDPAAPKRVRRLQVLAHGVPQSVDLRRGILAEAFASPIEGQPGKVLFFDTEGNRIGPVVPVGVQPVQLRFTPDGRVVVVNQGEANGAYTIDPEGSISIVDLEVGPECPGARCAIEAKAVQLDFREFNDRRTALRRQGVRIYGPGAGVAQDLEPEAVAIAPDGRKAWVSLQRNNALALIDLVGRRIEDIVALGAKDHSRPGAGLDPTDDGEIDIRPWPIHAFYMPDMIEAYDAGGETFLVTANEGDPRETGAFREDAPLGALTLDPELFPNRDMLGEDANLGRLRVSRVDGDVDGDGALDQVFALGGRSFAIWTGAGQLVFDSGDGLETIIAEAVPQCFNCAAGSIGFDDQSDDRGPEPEALAIGRIGGRDYAFIAAERIGGLFVYDITDPRAPVFQQYVNFRDFTVDPQNVCKPGRPVSRACAAAGDLEPEGVLLIGAADSPIGVPLVVVTHELSTTTTIYRVDAVPSAVARGAGPAPPNSSP